MNSLSDLLVPMDLLVPTLLVVAFAAGRLSKSSAECRIRKTCGEMTLECSAPDTKQLAAVIVMANSKAAVSEDFVGAR